MIKSTAMWFTIPGGYVYRATEGNPPVPAVRILELPRGCVVQYNDRTSELITSPTFDALAIASAMNGGAL